MNRKKVFIAGHNGMVGNAILRILNKNPQIEIKSPDFPPGFIIMRNYMEKATKNQRTIN